MPREDAQTDLPLPIADAPAGTVIVSEEFLSIQGEGALTGVPSYFVRTSGCNLRCGWCDTPYASWAPEGGPVAIADVVRRAARSGARHAVVTGGEPMIQKGIGPLTRALRDAGLHITIETAGTVYRGPDEIACDLMSVSPKLSNSTPEADDPRLGAHDPSDPRGWRARHEATRLDLATLDRVFEGFPSRQAKFVVVSPADIDEIDALVAACPSLRAHEIMLMPEGTETPEPSSVRWVADLCLERGWRYCHRLHVELFGNTRGT